MSALLKVGIAGYGVVGKRRREVIDANPTLVTVAVSDRVLDGDGTFDDGVRYYDDYRKLLAEDMDALFVCLTNDINPDATICGLERGMHVFCEKPPGRDVGDVIRVIEVERAHPGLDEEWDLNLSLVAKNRRKSDLQDVRAAGLRPGNGQLADVSVRLNLTPHPRDENHPARVTARAVGDAEVRLPRQHSALAF